MHPRALFSPLHHAPIARPLVPPRGASRCRRPLGGSRVASVSRKVVVRSGVDRRCRCVIPDPPKEWPSPRRDDDDPEYINPWEVPQPSPNPPSRRGTEYPEFKPPLDPDFEPSIVPPTEVPPVGTPEREDSLSLCSVLVAFASSVRSRVVHQQSSDRLYTLPTRKNQTSILVCKNISQCTYE